MTARGAGRAAAGLVVALGGFVALAPSWRFHHAGTIVDLSIFAESFARAIRGQGLRNSTHAVHYLPLDRGAVTEEPLVPLFADHVNPIVYLLLPCYALVPGPDTLFALQGLLTGSGVWPVFAMARAALGPGPGLAVAVLWALYPSVLAVSWHFLPGVLALPLLAWAMWAQLTGRRGVMFALLGLTLACSETAALPVLSFGAWLGLRRGQPRQGLAVALTAALWLIACLGWIIPGNAPAGDYPRNVYAPLGPSVTAAIRTVVTEPARAAPYLRSRDALRYVGGLLRPVAGLSLLRADLWLLALPMIAQNIFAGSPGPAPFRWPAGQWSASIAPFTFLALIGALAWLHRRFGPRALWGALALAGAATAWSVPPALSHPNSLWRDRAMLAAFAEVAARVPAGARIASDAPDLMLHDFDRLRVTHFPVGLAYAEWALVVHEHRPPPGPRHGPEYWRRSVRTGREFVPAWSADDPARDGRLVLYRRIRCAPGTVGRGARPADPPRSAHPSSPAARP